MLADHAYAPYARRSAQLVTRSGRRRWPPSWPADGIKLLVVASLQIGEDALAPIAAAAARPHAGARRDASVRGTPGRPRNRIAGALGRRHAPRGAVAEARTAFERGGREVVPLPWHGLAEAIEAGRRPDAAQTCRTVPDDCVVALLDPYASTQAARFAGAGRLRGGDGRPRPRAARPHAGAWPGGSGRGGSCCGAHTRCGRRPRCRAGARPGRRTGPEVGTPRAGVAALVTPAPSGLAVRRWPSSQRVAVGPVAASTRSVSSRRRRRSIGAALLALTVLSTPAVAAGRGRFVPRGLPAPAAGARRARRPGGAAVAVAARSPVGARSVRAGRRFELRVRLRWVAAVVAGLVARNPLRSLSLRGGAAASRSAGQRICLIVGRSRALCRSRAERAGRRRTLGRRPAAPAPTSAAPPPAPWSRRSRRTPAHLTPGRVVWRVSSDWAGTPACPTPTAGTAPAKATCHDVLPDTGGVAVRVHRAYTIGCVPAGASLRTSGPHTPRRVALTFDDGPGPPTPAVLRILRAARVHATFFQLGMQARLYPGLVRQVLAGGHAIANPHVRPPHRHRSLTCRADQRAGAHAGGDPGCDERLPAIRLFRPPGGVINGGVEALARRHRLLSVVWSVDPRDWAEPGSDAIVARVLAGVRPGGIVLLHDAGGPRSGPRRAAADHRRAARAPLQVRDRPRAAPPGARDRLGLARDLVDRATDRCHGAVDVGRRAPAAA